MRMENENENFGQLQKLLALKRHEQPPPGYFNRLPGEVVSRLRTELRADADPLAKLNQEAPWLLRLWQQLETKPAFAGAFGAGVCALLLAGIYFAEKPDATSTLPNSAAFQPNASLVASSPVDSTGNRGLTQPILLAGTNATGAPGSNLFDLIQPGPAMPASAAGLP